MLKTLGGIDLIGEDVHQVFEAILPQEVIDRFCREWGVIERQPKLHLGMLVRALVLSAGTPGGADQANILRSSLECEVPQVPARPSIAGSMIRVTVHGGPGGPRSGLVLQ